MENTEKRDTRIENGSEWPNETVHFDRTCPRKKWGACHYAKPTGPQISGNTRGKWNDIFWLKRANSLIRAKNRFCQNLGRNIPIEISGPPPDVIPNIPIRRNRNGLFEFYSKMLKSLANGKHPWPTSKSERIFSKLLPLDGTDLFRSSRPKFPEILVKWMAPI